MCYRTYIPRQHVVMLSRKSHTINVDQDDMVTCDVVYCQGLPRWVHSSKYDSVPRLVSLLIWQQTWSTEELCFKNGLQRQSYVNSWQNYNLNIESPRVSDSTFVSCATHTLYIQYFSCEWWPGGCLYIFWCIFSLYTELHEICSETKLAP